MPTGYTAGAQDGSLVTLQDYAFTCARNFGALIMMRDAPRDTLIPDRFEPSDYNAKEIAKAQDRLNILPKMSPVECDAAAEADYQEALASHIESARRNRESKRRYEDMLDQVERWKPDPMLYSLRDFMLEQLRSSLDFDCNERYQPDAAEADWRELAGRGIDKSFAGCRLSHEGASGRSRTGGKP